MTDLCPSADRPLVALVGAGPGDPGLLTLRGRDWLRRCDVVLYDGLSNTDMLAHAAGAIHQCVGKHGQSRIWRQSEIIDEMLAHARAGRRVVRLKGGDPAVFARTSEEVDALIAAEIPFEIVPGITAALAAGSYAGIPLTHRGVASAVALVTGHEEPGKSASDLDWDALARFPGTLVIYMGVTTAGQWTTALIDGGKDPATACAIIRRCSLNDQQKITCRLDEVAGELTPATKLRPPVLTIIGAVTELDPAMDWFSHRPLSGVNVLVTRPRITGPRITGPRITGPRITASNGNEPRAAEDTLSAAIADLGGIVWHQPAIELRPLDDFVDLDACLDGLSAVDWILFSSRHGVSHFLNRLRATGRDARSLSGCRIGVVGPATAAELARHHLVADLQPPRHDAESLVQSLVDLNAASMIGQTILSVRGSRGDDHFVGPLSAAGADVREVVAYQHLDVDTPDAAIVAAIADGRIDWVTITSGESARNLRRMLGDGLNRCRIAVISDRTADAARDCGLRVDAVARAATMDALADCVAGTP